MNTERIDEILAGEPKCFYFDVYECPAPMTILSIHQCATSEEALRVCDQNVLDTKNETHIALRYSFHNYDTTDMNTVVAFRGWDADTNTVCDL